MNSYEIAIWILTGFLVYMMGACMGSFLLVTVRRGHKHEKWTNTRSVCESCGKVLHWYEMIPTISYLALRGKCSKCKAKIDPSHFLCETGLGLVYLLLGYLVMSGTLKTDFEIISTFVTATILWRQTASDLLYSETSVIDVYVVAVAISLLTQTFIPVIIMIAIVNIINKNDNWKWLGAGDLDIVILIYAALARPLDLVNLAILSSATAIVGYLLYFRKTESKAIPFVPFLTIGYLLITVGVRFI